MATKTDALVGLFHLKDYNDGDLIPGAAFDLQRDSGWDFAQESKTFDSINGIYGKYESPDWNFAYLNTNLIQNNIIHFKLRWYGNPFYKDDTDGGAPIHTAAEAFWSNNGYESNTDNIHMRIIRPHSNNSYTYTVVAFFITIGSTSLFSSDTAKLADYLTTDYEWLTIEVKVDLSNNTFYLKFNNLTVYSGSIASATPTNPIRYIGFGSSHVANGESNAAATAWANFMNLNFMDDADKDCQLAWCPISLNKIKLYNDATYPRPIDVPTPCEVNGIKWYKAGVNGL